MNKNILLAGLLSIIAIFGTVWIYNTFFHDEEAAAAAEAAKEPVPEEKPATEEAPPPAEPLILTPAGGQASGKTLTLENEVFRLEFTTRGGRLVSAEMKQYAGSSGGNAELVLQTAPDILPFGIRSGDFTGDVLDAPFHYRLDPSGNGVTFYHDFVTGDGRALACRKTFTIQPGEYMVRLEVSFESENGEALPADGNGYLYSMEYGPQIGPEYTRLDGRADYRYYHISRGGEKKNMRAPAEGFHTIDDRVDWVGIEGKYFAVIALPPDRDYRLAWDARTDNDSTRLSFFYDIPADGLSSVEDTFYYFLGPKDRKILSRYDRPEGNGFGLEGQNFRRIIPGASFMLAITDGLKFVLDLLYAVIPNYGIVIILFTIIIELLVLPITKKSYDTTARLRAIAPRIRDIKKNFQYDREKMASKLHELYTEEGIKGRLNSLPLLVHLPIFLLLYSLLSSYIGFRMEMFIPGWIPDISRPDAILDIYPMTVPVLGWTALRGLPILMFISALAQSRYTQPPDQLGRSMIFMSFLLPILLLFVMYNMPSGVVLYWTVHNLLNLSYQVYRRKRG